MLPKDDYKNYEELARYARTRAGISAARRDPQAFAYWLRVANWAEDYERRGVTYDSLLEDLECGVSILAYPDEYRLTIDDMAWIHAQGVHARKLLKNRGVRTPRLSLDWLRRIAESTVGHPALDESCVPITRIL